MPKASERAGVVRVCGDRDSPETLTSVAHGAFPPFTVMDTL